MGSTAALPCLMLLCLLHLVAGASAQPRYLVLFPYVIYYPHGGKVHIHLMDLDGPVRVTLHLASSHGIPNVTLEETGNKILQLDWPLFPNISTPTEEVAYLHVSIQGGSLRVSQQRMVLLKAPGLWTAIQTDKTTYKPGQTVKFRILHLEEDFSPSDRKLPLVTVTDFGGRTIASWQDVSLQQGIVDLSLPLAHSSLGSYIITVEQTTHIFYVETNRPPHFQVLLQLPSFVMVTDEMIPLHVCGWYPSGKPFRGRAEARLCQWHNYYLNKPGKCATFEAETGRNGCFSTQISTASFNLTSPDYERRLYANAILTERRTGNFYRLTKSCNILPEMPTAAFKNTDGFYKHGMPPTGTGDLKEVPLPSKHESRNDSTVLNSSSSDSQSFLKIHRMKRTPPCRKPLRLRVDYVLNKEALGTELQSVDVVFLVMARDTIVSVLRKELTLEAGLRGSFSLELPVGPRLVPTAMVLGYVMLPGGNVVGDWAELHIAMCFPNQVKLSFPEQKSLAGSQVRLKVQAAPGSLCAIHIMDQPTSYYGLKAAYSSKVVYNLRPSSEDSSYSEYGAFCVDPYWGMHLLNAIPLNPYDTTSFEYKRRRARQAAEFLRFQDLCDPGVRAALRTVTNTVLNSSMAFQTVGLEKDKEEDEREPRPRQDQALQKDFPGTWLWELVPVGEEGSAEVPVTVPNAIMEWTAGMFCTAPTGLGLAPTVTLLTFKPFFVELVLPYAVTRGKTFTLAATVFSYLRQSLRVRVTLAESAELEVSASADGAESSCISGFKARTFRWDVKATSLGKVNVTVTAQALHSEELCNTEVPVVPAQGHVDTVTKLLAVEGEQVWAYAGGQLRPGFPRRIGDEFPGVPGGLDAAVECHPEECGGETILFFKGDKVFSFDLASRMTKQHTWPWLGPCDAALRWLERYYCLQGTQFQRFDPVTGEVPPGYPRDLRDYFIPCPGRGHGHGNASWGDAGARCSRLPFQAVISDDTGRIYAFRGGLMFRLDSWRDGWHAWPQGHSWPGLQGDVDAAFAWDGRTYLIQGSQVSIYLSGQGHRQVEGYPKALQDELGVPVADAAFTCPGSAELYVIAGDRMRRVDLTQTPRHAGELLQLPHDGVDGAMCTADGIFLFRGDSYYQYRSVDELLGARQPAPPKSIAVDLFHCPQ